MKIITNLKYSIIIAAIFLASSAYAFEVGGARHYCKPPQFRKFSPPERAKNQPWEEVEVEAESEISVLVMGSVDPSSIRVFAKKIVLKHTAVNKQSFFKITAKLPAELPSGFARIDLIVQADKGECVGKDGWLIKIKEKTENLAPAEPTEFIEEKPVVATEKPISSD